MVAKLSVFVFVFLLILGLCHFSLTTCPYQEVEATSVQCVYGDELISQTKGAAQNSTICKLEGGTFVLCNNGLWTTELGTNGYYDVLLSHSRENRGFLDDFKNVAICVITFFSCLWKGGRKQRDTTRPIIDCIPPIQVTAVPMPGCDDNYLTPHTPSGTSQIFYPLKSGSSNTTRPIIDCMPLIRVTAEPFQTYAKATWPIPTANDNKDGKLSVRRMNGRAPGRHFPEGRNDIVYVAKDKSGNRATCTVTVIVTVIKCPPPTSIRNGYFQCYPSDDHVLGGWCKFGCYNGFELSDPDAAILKCMSDKNWSKPQPICRPLTCEPPMSIESATLECTDNFNFRSICTYKCQTGFDMPPGVSKTIVCSNNKRWQGYGVIQCVDVERPVIQDCPSIVLAGTDVGSNSTKVSWIPPRVEDNGGHLTAKLESKYGPESRLTAGIYTIKYSATDGGGNKARDCTFNVNVRDIRCPRLYPTPYVQFSCPDGYRTGTVCDVKCDPGKTISGSENVLCSQSRNGMYGEWSWKGGNQTTCISTHHCEAIAPPANGAVVCDNWLGGAFCQAQCSSKTDMAGVDLNKLYVCNTEGSWFPTPRLRKCRAVRHPNLHSGLSASGYFPGDCTDPIVQETIKNNFINVMRESNYQKEACPDSTNCNKGNVVVKCGQKERRKREAGWSYVTLHITLPLVMGNETAYDMIREKTIEFQEKSIQFAKEVFKRSFGEVNETTINYVRHGFSFDCPKGSVKSSNGIKCVECPEGTFYIGQTCETCPKGTYQSKAAQTSCIPCAYDKTTKHTGSASLSDCEDACPPGHHSTDGLFPCSPCEIGHYQQLHGQTRCHECRGSKSTVTVGKTSISNCQEFDIDIHKGNASMVSLQLPKSTNLGGFTLSFWIKTLGNDNSTGLTLHMDDQFGEHTWSASIGLTLNGTRIKLECELMLENTSNHLTRDAWENNDCLAKEVPPYETTNTLNSMTQNEINLPDTKWHEIVMRYENCTTFASIDGMPLRPNPNQCSTSISMLVITTDGGFSGSISQINMWDKSLYEQTISKCHASSKGNILKWKMFEDSTIDGNAVFNFPSECDDFDNCVSGPCIHGICTDKLHGYHCECNAGFTGSQCDTNIDDCEANICMNNATCIDGVQDYVCQCGPNLTGQFCEIEMVDGGWTDWGNWSECTSTCGPGKKQRIRSCTNPSPDNGGEPCQGETVDMADCNQTDCAVCPDLEVPMNSEADCRNMTDSINCTLFCIDGYEFDIEPMQTYYCGPETFHEWNFQTDENPKRKLPSCMRKHQAESLSVTYDASYETLVCNDKDVETAVKSLVTEKLKHSFDTIPCYNDGTCTVDKMDVTHCNHRERRKRSGQQASFVVTISTNPTKDNGTLTLPSFQDAITKLNNDAINGEFTLDIQGQIYKLNLNSTGLTGGLQCGSGMTRVDHFCIPCGKGAYLQDGECEFCTEGTYQDLEGQDACKVCPKGRTTEGVGATDIIDCTVPLNEDCAVGIKVGAVVAGSLSGVVVIFTLFFIYRRYRPNVKNVTEPTNITKEKPRPTAPPMADRVVARKSMFNVKTLHLKH